MKEIHEKPRKSNWSIVLIILGISILCFAGITLYFGFDEASIRMNIRWSARFSLICFCLAFIASAFNLLLPNNFSHWLIKDRKYFGISFALIHLIHLAFLVQLHQNFDRVFEYRAILELFLGGLAYVFLILMLFTSFKTFSNLISKRSWKLLHTIGGYWILIVLSNSIFGRIVSGKIEYLPFGILLFAVWGFRLIAWRRKSIA